MCILQPSVLLVSGWHWDLAALVWASCQPPVPSLFSSCLVWASCSLLSSLYSPVAWSECLAASCPLFILQLLSLSILQPPVFSLFSSCLVWASCSLLSSLYSPVAWSERLAASCPLFILQLALSLSMLLPCLPSLYFICVWQMFGCFGLNLLSVHELLVGRCGG